MKCHYIYYDFTLSKINTLDIIMLTLPELDVEIFLLESVKPEVDGLKRL